MRKSAWSNGVNEYVVELLDNINESIEYHGRKPGNMAELKEMALNGAENWEEYSWGGMSLIYNEDIAERLCNPSELERSKNGQNRPNSREEWLDTQARALYQAFEIIRNAYAAGIIAPAEAQTAEEIA